MAATGRIRKRLALAIVLTALIPVLVSIWLAEKTMRNTVARLYLPDTESHLVRSLEVYKELSRSVKSLMSPDSCRTFWSFSPSVRRSSERRVDSTWASKATSPK